MNIANLIQRIPTTMQKPEMLGSYFGTNSDSIELPFHAVLEQQLHVMHVNKQGAIDSIENEELGLAELEEIFALLSELTKEDAEELFGKEYVEIFFSEFETWQHSVNEQSQSLEDVINSFLALFGIQTGEVINTQSIAKEIQSLQMDEEAKGVLLRILYLIGSASKEEKETSDRTMFSQKQEESSTPQHSLANLRRLIEQSSQARQASSESSTQQEDSTQRLMLQPNVTFQQTSMDRLHQLEWRIQLLNETDGANLIDQFEKMLTSSRLRTFKNGLTELNVRLHPEHLGSLSIKLTQQNGNLIARIVAQTEAAKSLLDSQLHQLRHAFIGQNIQVERIEILSQHHSEHQPREGHAQADQDHPQHQMEQGAEHWDDEHKNEEQSFREWLESLIL